MMLTTKARYGVMAMLDLAAQDKDQPVTLQDIANRQMITVKYLEQIFNKLKKTNLVTAYKGPRGGYKLSRSARDIYIIDILRAVDEQIKMTRCSGEDGCLDKRIKCATHSLWAGLGEQIYNYFNSINLHSLLEIKLPYIIDTQGKYNG